MKQQDNEWMSISDMMSGLMLIFMFIAISFMIDVQTQKEKMEEVVLTYNKDKKELNEALHKEFANDLKKWNAEILSNNTIRFNSPDILFDLKESSIKNEFKTILDDFFPRYINTLITKYKNDIEEIRIEGHTSSDWNNEELINRYIYNAELSQQRAFSVLSYCMKIDKIKYHQQWLIDVLRANGLSFAKPIINIDKTENKILSRRVEFRITTKTEEKMYKIMEVAQ